MDAGYEPLDHTADVGLMAWGPTPAEAFSQAARGMFAIILGQDPEQWRGSGHSRMLDVAAEGQDWPELLVNWLAELLFHFETSGFVLQRTHFERCLPPECVSRVEGVCLERAEDLDGVGVKAVTYHELTVDVTPARTDVHVIFDI